MPQMHFYVPEVVAGAVRHRSVLSGQSTSGYLAALVKREVHTGWPEGYAEAVLGKWQGDPLARDEQGAYERRLEL